MASLTARKTVLLVSPPPSSSFFCWFRPNMHFHPKFWCYNILLLASFLVLLFWSVLFLGSTSFVSVLSLRISNFWMWFDPKIRQKPVKNPKSSGSKHHKFPTRKTVRRFSLRCFVQKPTYRVGLRQVSELETCWWWSTRLLVFGNGIHGETLW